ncbi:MAG: 50S ribosomal protein L25 [Pirellulales bacterium]|nr:50S ribosomal protein L25 [Pirellulales bacterium]
MPDLLDVEPRTALGKLNSRRMRKRGQLPAVLYGHGEESLSLTVVADQLDATLRHGAHLVELQGAADGQALLQHVQWDTFQSHVLHVDLLRVKASDRVKVEIPVLIRGEAPGESEGGVVEHVLHSVEIETSAASIPDKLHLNINNLHLGGLLRSADIEDMPAGAEVITDASAVLVQCVEVTGKEAGEAGEAATESGAEPEVIGEKAEEEGAAE